MYRYCYILIYFRKCQTYQQNYTFCYLLHLLMEHESENYKNVFKHNTCIKKVKN